MNDCHLEKAIIVSTKVSPQDTHYNARLKSSVASASPSTSLCSQQSKCSNYSYATSFYKSVISISILYNDSRGLHGSSELHGSVKKFGENMWLEYLNTAIEWQIEGFVEKYKKMKDRTALLKGSLLKFPIAVTTIWGHCLAAALYSAFALALTEDRTVAENQFCGKLSCNVVETETPVYEKLKNWNEKKYQAETLYMFIQDIVEPTPKKPLDSEMVK
ncbi:uncharacterized protein LOC126108417 [Schistocerca cancellata]|uniref:uncharacterized protein LOC126108417 n=1 Tax=Schistocerca cancellata TaxID=274614 RepID=UPI0021186B5D|nr:uncharacterized protein LOC126108417 [Schistocerca cancellata]